VKPTSVAEYIAKVHQEEPLDYPFNCTDVGNAARFARENAGVVLHAEGQGWTVYDGRRFKLDDTGEIVRLARATVRSIFVEAANCDDQKRRNELSRWATASEGRRGIDNMLALAKSEMGIASHVSQFDRDPFVLNVLTGTLNLRTAELLVHDRGDKLTKLAPTSLRPGATFSAEACPTWTAFLHQILPDPTLVDFLQRAIGYSLTGDTSEQVIFICYGAGANGKSTLLEVLRAVLGDYATMCSAETLMVKANAGGIPNDIARLRAARFLTATETDDGRRLAEGLVKQMTGGDTMTARFLHKEFFEFKATFKVWLATNHKPVIRGTDYAIWRRIRLIPFTVTIPESERDKGLKEKLLAEASGILAWAVEGCRIWQELGLGHAAAVTAATEAYREEMDPLGDFIADACVVAPGLQGHGLYSAYEAWANRNGVKGLLSMRAFSQRLQERGFPGSRNSRGRYFQGVGLAAEGSEP
jgi:putative DNA primase/helicase